MVRNMDGAVKRVLPYLSYRTFRNFLDGLAVSGIPTRIDRSVIPSMSGSSQALLLSTVRYLGLVTEKGVPTPNLDLLVHSEGSKRQQVWQQILIGAYANVFNSGVDLERTTTQELAEAFAKQGVTSPETIRKCVTFFSLAAKDAGIKLSPHVKPYAGRRQAPRRARITGEERTETPLALPEKTGSSEWELLVSKFPSFDPSWPENLRDNWYEGFERLARVLRDKKSQFAE